MRALHVLTTAEGCVRQNGRVIARPGSVRPLPGRAPASAATVREALAPRPSRQPDQSPRPRTPITPAHLRQARLDIGRQLARWRRIAELTQADLASRVFCSRSTIANIETGRQTANRRFWQQADRLLDAKGLLVKGAAQLDDLARAYASQLSQVGELEQHHEQIRQEPGAPAAVCQCARTIARWTGRETHALREALRMSMRAFAEHLGVTTATVGCWERPAEPKAPRMSTQDMLDQALKLADHDARARFWHLLAHE